MILSKNTPLTDQVFKEKKAFTLIELLIVIAIIGILASVVLVSLNSARAKAKDATIIAAANSMMKAAQFSYLSIGSYAGYMFAFWNSNATSSDCNSSTSFDSLPTAERANMKAVCGKIVDTISGAPSNHEVWAVFWTGGVGGAPVRAQGYIKYSIITYLPGKNTFYCIGSNGRTSMTTATSPVGSGCGDAGAESWQCPGCPGDPDVSGDL